MVADTGAPLRLCAVEDVPSGGGRIVRAENRAIALFRVGEEVFALDNVCPHWGGPLGDGLFEGRTVTCPWHAWQFDVCTGEAMFDPGKKVHCFPVHVTGDDVFVEV